MVKAFCVLDADVGSHLRQIELGGKSAYKWMRNEFHLACVERVSEEVAAGVHHYSELKEASRLYQSIVKSVPHLERVEKRVLAELDNEKNMGERYSLILCCALVLNSEAGHVILISDDQSAKKLFLSQFFENHPIGCLWTSWDFLFYLYLRHGPERLKREQMQVALRDLNLNIGVGRSDSVGQDMLITRLTEKTRRLDALDRVLYAGIEKF